MKILSVKHIGSLALGTLVLAFFQNCGEQVSFEQANLKSGSDLSSQIELIDERTVNGLDDLNLEGDSSVGLDPNDEVASDVTRDDGAMNDQDSNEVVEMPAAEQPVLHGQERTRPERERVAREEKDNSLGGSGTLFRCVVVGNGKSQHIGLIDGKAAIDINTPKTLCMSENACLSIMADVFPVLEAKFTGYCAHNKAHTHAISDGEALTLVEELAK